MNSIESLFANTFVDDEQDLRETALDCSRTGGSAMGKDNLSLGRYNVTPVNRKPGGRNIVARVIEYAKGNSVLFSVVQDYTIDGMSRRHERPLFYLTGNHTLKEVAAELRQSYQRTYGCKPQADVEAIVRSCMLRF